MELPLINLIMELLQHPLVFYTLLLTFVWVVIQLISGKGLKSPTLNFDEKYVSTVILLLSLVSVLISIYWDVNLFPFIYAVLMTFILWLSSSGFLKSNRRFLFATVLLFVFTPIIVTTSTKHPLPLGDDARFIGFAAAMNSDGRWIPFKYVENPYYQFFHLIPFLEYVLSTVTGFGALGITGLMGYYLTLKYCIYLTYFIFVYFLVKEITREISNSFIALLLLSITPTLSLIQLVHQYYAIVLSLVTIYLMLKLFRDPKPLTAILIILFIPGIIAHATYTLIIASFLLPLLITKVSKAFRSRVSNIILILIMMSLAYWMYTYVFDVIARPGVNALTRLVDLLTGRTIPFQEARLPWYTSGMEQYFWAWALIPSITSAYLILQIASAFLGKNGPIIPLKSYVGTLGLLGLVATGVNFLLRSLPTFGGRYFYWLYLLMLPLSAITIIWISRKSASLILSITLISVISFYGIQDPTLSANTFGNKIGWADRTSWEITSNLASYIDHSAKTWLDPRIGVPISALSSQEKGSATTQQVIAIVGIDEVGLYGLQKNPHAVHFFAEYFDIEPKELMNYVSEMNVVFSGSVYLAIWAP